MTFNRKVLSHSTTNHIKPVLISRMTCFNVKKFCIFSTRYIYLFHLSLKSMAIIWLNNFNLLTFVIGKHYVLWDL
jgi:hypothetical protein